MGGRGASSELSHYIDHLIRSNLRELDQLQDKAVYKSILTSIARYNNVFGVKIKNIKLATLRETYLGETIYLKGKAVTILLDAKLFNKNFESICSEINNLYKLGFWNRTNNPIAHVITHELAHATWSSYLSTKKAQRAGSEINNLYNKWNSDKRKKNYGEYAKMNVNEFFAETVTKLMYGKPDFYTNEIKKIIKRHRL